MPFAARRLAALVAVATLALAGCGGSDDDSAQPSDGASGSPSAAEGDNAVEIEVEIEHGQVTPSGDRVDVQVGQTIALKVDSDAADELHVHSTPDHEFRVRPGMDDKIFRFRLTQPGVVEVELHEQGDVVVTLAARP